LVRSAAACPFKRSRHQAGVPATLFCPEFPRSCARRDSFFAPFLKLYCFSPPTETLHAARYIPSFAFHAKLDAWNRVCMQLCINLNIYEAHEGTAKNNNTQERAAVNYPGEMNE
jgi:hypothetical protein